MPTLQSNQLILRVGQETFQNSKNKEHEQL